MLTSASRPELGRATAPPPLASQVLARALSPTPTPAAAASAPAQPRKPAIIRRAPAGAAAEQKSTPAGGYASLRAEDSSPGVKAVGDSTRIANIAELEQQAAEERSAREQRDMRSKTPTAQPLPAIPDDDYEIEIGADDARASASSAPGAPSAPMPATASAPVAPASGAVRRTAHVLRRADHATKPPPGAPQGAGAPLAGVAPMRSSSPAFELDADEPPPPGAPVPVAPASEDDFSDVAQALGAAPDLQPVAAAPPSPVGLDSPTFRPGTPSRTAARAAEVRPPSVDDVLADLDADSDVSADRTVVGMSPARPATPIPDLDTSEDLEATFDGPRPAPRSRRRRRLRTRRARRRSSICIRASRRRRRCRRSAGSQARRRPRRAHDRWACRRRRRAVDPQARRHRGARVHRRRTSRTSSRRSISTRSQLPEQVQPLLAAALDEDGARLLAIYERELATVDESATSAALRIEAGRLCERLGELDRARAHYDAALLADPRATPRCAACAGSRARAATSSRRRASSTPRSRSRARSSAGRSATTASIC